MHNKKLDQLIVQLENYLECWKQFNYFVTLARSKKFTAEDENQFLEVKESSPDYTKLDRRPYRLGGAKRAATAGIRK